MRIYYSQQHFSLGNHFQGARAGNFSIDMINVRKLLEDSFPNTPSQKSAKSEARLHQFLDAIEKSVEVPYANISHDGGEESPPTMLNDEQQLQSPDAEQKKRPIVSFKPKDADHIREYLDQRLNEIERNICERLDEMEQRQAAKLDRILEFLENKSFVYP